MSYPQIQKVKKLILDELKDLGAYIYHTSSLKNSVYIKFSDSRLGSVRISNHEGIEKYNYKWNIREDLPVDFQLSTKPTRFYYSFDALNQFFNRIRQYNQTIQQNTKQ